MRGKPCCVVLCGASLLLRSRAVCVVDRGLSVWGCMWLVYRGGDRGVEILAASTILYYCTVNQSFAKPQTILLSVAEWPRHLET